MESKEFADIKAMHVTAFDEVMKEKLVPIIGAEVAFIRPKDRRDPQAATSGVRP